MAKFHLAILIIALCNLASADNVPVLIWGTGPHYTFATALKAYSSDEFTDILTSYIKEDTFGIVITENSLSNEDLSLCKTSNGTTCFAGIQKIPNRLYLSTVEDPVDILQELADTDQPDIYITANDVLSAPMVPEAGKFIFLSLQDAAHGENRSTVLSRHDNFITKLTQELSAKKKNFIIIYTAKHSSTIRGRHIREAQETSNNTNPQSSTTQKTPESTTPATVPVKKVENVPSSPAPAQPERQATDKPTEHPIFFHRDRVLLYYTRFLTVDGATDTPVNITTVTVQETTSTKLTIEMTDGGQNRFSFSINNQTGYWNMDDAILNDVPLLFQSRIEIVEGFSYHCTPDIVLRTIPTTTQDSVVKLRWGGLQVQPYFGPIIGKNQFNSFSDAWDCIGFTSPGIWGGLFVTLLMLFILSIGLTWMMDIRTMDRFDDPKGKTITVNISE